MRWDTYGISVPLRTWSLCSSRARASARSKSRAQSRGRRERARRIAGPTEVQRDGSDLRVARLASVRQGEVLHDRSKRCRIARRRRVAFVEGVLQPACMEGKLEHVIRHIKGAHLPRAQRRHGVYVGPAGPEGCLDRTWPVSVTPRGGHRERKFPHGEAGVLGGLPVHDSQGACPSTSTFHIVRSLCEAVRRTVMPSDAEQRARKYARYSAWIHRFSRRIRAVAAAICPIGASQRKHPEGAPRSHI